MARTTIGGGVIWPKLTLTPKWKIEIGGKDYSQYVMSTQVSRTANFAISGFITYLANPDGDLAGKFAGGELVEISADFTTASNKIFSGRLERCLHSLDRWNGDYIRLSGRSEEVKLFERNVSANYTDYNAADALKDLIDSYNPSAGYFTYANVEATTGTVTIRFQDTPFWQAVNYIASKAQAKVFVDTSRDFHMFAEGTKDSGLTISRGTNLVNLRGVGFDMFTLKNKVKIYGDLVEFLPIIRTAEDLTSQQKYWIKEKIDKSSMLTDGSEVSEYAQTILDDRKDLVTRGQITAIGLPTLLPGQTIKLFCPQAGLDGTYEVLSLTHKFGLRKLRRGLSGGFLTDIFIKKEDDDMPANIKQGVDVAERLRSANNPYGLDNSVVFTYESDSQTRLHEDTTVEGGYLNLVYGKSSGTWTGNSYHATKAVTKVHVKLNGNSSARASAVIEYSTDDGTTWYEIAEDELGSVTGGGADLVLRITFDNSRGTPWLESACILWT